MTAWNTSLRRLADTLIRDGLTDNEVGDRLAAEGLDARLALFHAVRRRARLIKSGEDFAAGPMPTTVPAATPAATPVPAAPVNVPATGHYLLARLLKLLRAGANVYLWGPAGSGKTSAALMAADALDRQAELDTLDPSTFRSMVQGYRTPEGEPVHTAFTRCWEAGAVYVADELDNAPGHVQTLFNAALANGHAPLAWGSVDRRDSFGFVGTGNTPGRPTRAFPDRRPMSAAFTDRLYFLYWPIDPAIECRAAGLPVPAAPTRDDSTCTAASWVTWVQRVRSWATTNAPTLLVTPRASLDGIKALGLGESPSEVADGLVFRGCDDELRAKCLAANPLPVA